MTYVTNLEQITNAKHFIPSEIMVQMYNVLILISHSLTRWNTIKEECKNKCFLLTGGQSDILNQREWKEKDFFQEHKTFGTIARVLHISGTNFGIAGKQ